MKYYLIAGERSGDLHGSNLIKAIKSKDSNAKFRFWGGELMEKEGVNLVKHYEDIAVMGFWEVIKNFRKITGFLSQCKQDILEYHPDVVILIDFGGFNMRIAKFAHNKGIKVFYYITPKVWAWNTSRAWKIKKNVDRMFVILPFEKDFYQQFDWDVDYVGNPVVDAVKTYQIDSDFVNGITDDRPIVAVLPGSRKQEVERMLPVMNQVIEHFPEYKFIIAGVGTLPASLYKIPGNAVLYIDKTYEILSMARAAIVTSGTATLETALWNVPQVVGYITGPATYAIGSRLVSVKYFSLVNLIADRTVVLELLQKRCTPEAIINELEQLVTESPRRSKVIEGYDEIRNILGNHSVSEKTAELMIGYLE